MVFKTYCKYMCFLIIARLSLKIYKNKKENISFWYILFSGERGIRTPGTLTSTPVFKTGSFDHSDISPRLSSLFVNRVGVEPTTHRLRVCCSTNWATDPLFFGRFSKTMQRYGFFWYLQMFSWFLWNYYDFSFVKTRLRQWVHYINSSNWYCTEKEV